METNADPTPTPLDLVTQLRIVAGNLQRLWKEPKTGEVVNQIHDLGLHFRLLTDAYDAEVAKMFPETGVGQ